MKEKLPTLLASKQGLYVACALFTVMDAKDRKIVVKSLKEAMKEMFTNKIAHLFIVHILNTLDDTTISKKKIITVTNTFIIVITFEYRN
jgi:pumilio family protein 6